MLVWKFVKSHQKSQGSSLRQLLGRRVIAPTTNRNGNDIYIIVCDERMQNNIISNNYENCIDVVGFCIRSFFVI